MRWPDSARAQMGKLRQSGIPLSRVTRRILRQDQQTINRTMIAMAGGYVVLAFGSAMAISLVAPRHAVPLASTPIASTPVASVDLAGVAELVAASVPVARSAVPSLDLTTRSATQVPHPRPRPAHVGQPSLAAPDSASQIAALEAVSLTGRTPETPTARVPTGAKIISVAPAAARTSAEPGRTCVADLVTLAKGSSILFASGVKDVSGPDLVRALTLASAAVDCPGVRVTVAGYSDASGDPDDNMRLSWYRAESVLSAIGAAGFDTSGFDAVGYGSRRAGPAQTETGASDADRRVDFIVSRLPVATAQSN